MILDWYNSIHTLFENNAVLQGAGALSIVGGIGASIFGIIRSIPKKISGLIHRFLILEIQITEPDILYYLLEQWLFLNTRIKKSNNLQLVTQKQINSSQQYSGVIELGVDKDDQELKHYLIPGIGKNYFWYKKKLFCIAKEENTNTKANKPVYSYTFSTLKFNKKHFNQIIQETKDLAKKAVPTEIEIFKHNAYNEWNRTPQLKPKRYIDTVVMDGDNKDRIVNDLRSFLESKQDYNKFGIPFHRGYCLEGVPGTGKTSLILALAAEFNKSIYLLNLCSKSLTDECLQELFDSKPADSIIVIEDIDAAFVGRERHPDNESSVSFNGLLNCLDGISTAEDTILFLTTNRVEVLDEALLRNGRIDFKLHFGYATEKQIKQLYNRFFPDAKSSEVDDFVLTFEGKQVNMAEVQEICFTKWKEKNNAYS